MGLQGRVGFWGSFLDTYHKGLGEEVCTSSRVEEATNPETDAQGNICR